MTESAKQMDVSLETFEGPLDLLLHLIKKNDLEIKDIPIAQITHEYLGYLDLMKDLNLEMAGEFLVMASTLMQIKAQMLLPAPDVTDEESGPDPRAELVNKLLEYQRFKEASGLLSAFNERAKDIYYRRVPPPFEHDDFMLRATTFDLLSAFKRVLDRAPREVGQILREEVTIESKIREMLDRLETSTSLDFEELFHRAQRRIDLIVTFLALLELIRMKQIVAMQPDTFGHIRIYRADAAPVTSDTIAAEASHEPTPAPALPLEESPLATVVEEGAPETAPTEVESKKEGDL